jgi:hypothetical protein
MLTVTAAFVAVFALSVPAFAQDAWIGAWKVNLAKSKYSPGPPPKNATIKFEATQGGAKLTSDGVNADGKATHFEYVSKFDGKDVPFTGNPDADTASPRRIDANTIENIWKKAGKTTITSKVVVSKDGKTLTNTQTGKDGQGRTVNSTVVYDKQ